MKNLNIDDFQGLSSSEVEETLKRDGFNELPSTKSKTVFSIALSIVKEPMFLLLVAFGTLYLIIGNVKEALLLMSFVIVIMGITFIQERKTERALEALKDLSSPRALVIRDGRQSRIPGREVVSGDIIILSEGDRVPADGIVLRSINLSADESLLTGESVPVRKSQLNHPNDEENSHIPSPGGDDLAYAFSGSLVVQGQGIMKISRTGQNTEMGKIGKALTSIESEDTLLKKETGKIVKNIAIIGIVLTVIIILVFGLVRKDWLHGILAGLTLAMSILPGEFPVVLTVFLALGAWRLSKEDVLTRRVPAVETLGAATVLCVDKTGTLTQNRMDVSELYANGKFQKVNYQDKIPEDFLTLIECGIFASRKNSFDPMEQALRKLGDLKLNGIDHLLDDWELIEEYPLSSELLAMSNAWKSRKKNQMLINAKGAPEAIFDLCHLPTSQVQELSKAVKEMSRDGLRVLGAAWATFPTPELPDNQHDFDFEFVGLIGFADPVRPSVPNAIRECYKAGIRVIMITGDHHGTASSIARQIDLKNPDDCISGKEMSRISDEDLIERIKNVNVFCRVIPEQKLRIVNALKANGEIVAMTGDGVNDAPALKSANIGIAMGDRGTDVARESAGLVLLDDDFSSIVKAVKMGRRIFDNLKKAMSYLLSVHVPIAGLSLLPVLLNRNMILFPVHIVFLELIIAPACSIVFEAEKAEPNLLNRPPRPIHERLFGKDNIRISLIQGLAVLAGCILVYFFGIEKGKNEFEARALAFTTLIIANLGLILTNRSWSESFIKSFGQKNMAFYLVCAGAALFLSITLFVPGVRNLFKFSPLHFDDILLCLGVGLISISWFEIQKKYIRKYGINTVKRK